MKANWFTLALAAAVLSMTTGICFGQGIWEPCSPVVLSGTGSGAPPWGLFVCPMGDSNDWDDQQGLPGSHDGFIVTVTMLDLSGNPIPNIPASDFWVYDCDPTSDLVLCVGSASTNADSVTNAAGTTTIGGLGTTAAGGCADGLIVIVAGVIIRDPATDCSTDLCLPISVRSADITGDLEVTLSDLTTFSFSFPPGAYDPCCDMNVDATISLADLSLFAFHFGPPGHICI